MIRSARLISNGGNPTIFTSVHQFQNSMLAKPLDRLTFKRKNGRPVEYLQPEKPSGSQEQSLENPSRKPYKYNDEPYPPHDAQ